MLLSQQSSLLEGGGRHSRCCCNPVLQGGHLAGMLRGGNKDVRLSHVYGVCWDERHEEVVLCVLWRRWTTTG